MAKWHDDQYAQVLAIADDLGATEIRQRAAQAFSWANECRARYTSVLDTDKRGRAIAQAESWARVLCYLDRSGRDVFRLGEYREYEEGPGARGHWWKWVPWAFNLPAWVRSWKEVFGTAPIEFYKPPRGQSGTVGAGACTRRPRACRKGRRGG